MGTFRENFSTNLSDKLQKLALPQKKFAELMEVSATTTSHWLSGEKIPRDHQIDRMREIFGWSYEELVRDPDSPYDPVISFLTEQLTSRGYQVFKKPTKR